MSNQAPWKLLRGLFSSVVPAQTLSRAGGKLLWKIERDWTWAHRYSSPKWLHTENSLHDDEIEQHENPKICCHKLDALTASRYLCRKIIIFWRHKSQTAAAYITLGWLMSTQRPFSFSDTVQLRTCTTLSKQTCWTASCQSVTNPLQLLQWDASCHMQIAFRQFNPGQRNEQSSPLKTP